MSELIRKVSKGLKAGFSLLLLLASSGPARADRIVGENGRELLAPDGRTLVDKQDGFSIVLPASDWKVHFYRYEPFAQGDSGFQLTIAPPDGEVRLRIHEKVYPMPVSLERVQKLVSRPEPRVRLKRCEVVDVVGMKCLEYEAEFQGQHGWLHNLSLLCDRNVGRKFSVEVFPGVPGEEWPAEEKVLRELVNSFRILH